MIYSHRPLERGERDRGEEVGIERAGGREGERDRDRERQRDRERETETERQTEKQRQRERGAMPSLPLQGAA